MIVRILGEGQWRVDDKLLESLNPLDTAVEKAVNNEDEKEMRAALLKLLDKVRMLGEPIPDGSLRESDWVLPDADSTLAEVRSWLEEQPEEDGLIPN